jgi:hypothetical protein
VGAVGEWGGWKCVRVEMLPGRAYGTTTDRPHI